MMLANWLGAYLACSVDYLGSKILPSMLDDFTECVLDSWVVAVDEVVLHESHCEGGFS